MPAAGTRKLRAIKKATTGTRTNIRILSEAESKPGASRLPAIRNSEREFDTRGHGAFAQAGSFARNPLKTLAADRTQFHRKDGADNFISADDLQPRLRHANQ